MVEKLVKLTKEEVEEFTPENMDNKIKNPLTIKAVAKLAGVTPALISRVINDDITLSIRA